MNTIQKTLQAKIKPKEKVILLTEKIKKDKKLFKELMEILETGTDVEKGTCADAIKHITKDNTEIAKLHINEIIGYINSDVTRVKWGVPEAIGNMAEKFPEEIAEAIPKLFVNLKKSSTVIRWCAAYGLTKIAKYNSKEAKTLLPKFKEIIRKEKNNGVKSVFVKENNTSKFYPNLFWDFFIYRF
ncbi:MAG: hypothetical protein U9N04_00390 [Patescibacteria group bacterium]|nr:hypothetical protein [Patescibacteria group bacterium]